MNMMNQAGNAVKQIANGASAFYQKLLTAMERSKIAWPTAYNITLQIPPSGTIQGTFRIAGQGDFLLEYLVGKIFAYNPSTPTVVDTAVSTGVLFQVNESGNNRDLFDSPIPAENVLTPGYGVTIFERWNLRDYWFKGTSTIRVIAQNTNATDAQQLTLSFLGHQSIGGGK
jgi:hypothetical protein